MTPAIPTATVERPPYASSRSRSTAASLLVACRPEQWTKNLFVFAALLFARRLTDPHALSLTIGAFLTFCALSSAVYLFNDIADRDADRRHPIKRRRPIAAGELGVAPAAGAGAILAGAGLAAAFTLAPAFGITAAAYLGLQAAYSTILKHVVILDALAVALGFVLRAVAGGVVIAVPVSNWLLACTTLLALFISLAKRRHEITALAGEATGHRPILTEYTPYLLDQMIAVVTASTVVAYAVYTTSPDTSARLGTTRLSLTIPFVLYGIFRYLYLLHRKDGGGSPSTLLLSDAPLLGCVVLWASTVAALLYTPVGQL